MNRTTGGKMEDRHGRLRGLILGPGIIVGVASEARSRFSPSPTFRTFQILSDPFRSFQASPRDLYSILLCAPATSGGESLGALLSYFEL